MTEEDILDINNRQKDFEILKKETTRLEVGLRAIAFMYDDHSNDKNSYGNIVNLKENIHYRLFSATHQYLVFLRELTGAEEYLQKLHQANPRYINAFPLGNPFFDKVELELSSIFDNIIFQISSVFDYLSHIVCYISYKQKSKTDYWTKLARTSRGKNNNIDNLEIKRIIDEVDRRFVARLYDYRSRLLHNKRDKHLFGGQTNLENFDFNIQIIPSKVALKHFKTINTESASQRKITLTYLASSIIKRSFIEIETILDVLSVELRRNSHFNTNLRKPKRENGFMLVSMNPNTKFAEPASDKIWKEFKKNKAPNNS